MKLTNLIMLQYITYLNEIAPKTKGKLGYAVSRNIRKISEELIDFEQARMNLIYKYGVLNAESQEYIISEDTSEYKKFLDEINILSSIEHNVDIYKIDIDSIIQSDLTAQEMNNIFFMIEEE